MVEFKEYPRQMVTEATITHAALFTENGSRVEKLETPVVMKKYRRRNAFQRLIYKLKIGVGHD